MGAEKNGISGMNCTKKVWHNDLIEKAIDSFTIKTFFAKKHYRNKSMDFVLMFDLKLMNDTFQFFCGIERFFGIKKGIKKNRKRKKERKSVEKIKVFRNP